MSAELWVSSGHLLLDHTEDGRLRLTDEFLRAFLARPELMPPEEACDAERALHAHLLATPAPPPIRRASRTQTRSRTGPLSSISARPC